jgi:hypothetical protein
MSSKTTQKNKPLSSQSNRQAATKSKSASKDAKPKDPKLFNMLMANLTKLTNGSDAILNELGKSQPSHASNLRSTSTSEPKSLQELARQYDSRDANKNTKQISRLAEAREAKSKVDNYSLPKQVDLKNVWEDTISQG